MREKLALLVCRATQRTNYKCDFNCKKRGKCAYCLVIAEELLARGVTVTPFNGVSGQDGPSTRLYWVSAIVQNQTDKKPRLLAMNEGELSLEKAMEIVARVKENHMVLSVWIDVFDENNSKQTVFHECYIDAFGDIWAVKEA